MSTGEDTFNFLGCNLVFRINNEDDLWNILYVSSYVNISVVGRKAEEVREYLLRRGVVGVVVSHRINRLRDAIVATEEASLSHLIGRIGLKASVFLLTN